MDKYCLKCQKKLEPRIGKSKINPKRRFCDNICQSRYTAIEWYKNYGKKGRTWQKINPKRFNTYQRERYKKSKIKFISRSLTYKVLLFHTELLKKICKKCLSENYLEIHHEIYPITTEEIINAIKERKIYFLCRDCHIKIYHK